MIPHRRRGFEYKAMLYELLERAGIKVESTSVSNSGAIEQKFGLEESHVRPGIILYGPSSLSVQSQPFSKWRGELVSSLKSYVIHKFKVKKGEEIGYGSTQATEDGEICMLSIGYGDGISRSFKEVRIELMGNKGKVIGNVNMDMTSILFAKSNQTLKTNDSVELWGSDRVYFSKLSEGSGKIPYELLCGLTDRVTRTYRR